MESIVRTLLTQPGDASTRRGSVVARASERWRACPEEMRDGHALSLLRRAVLREALECLGELGEVPLVVSPTAWTESLEPGAGSSPGSVLTLVPSAGGSEAAARRMGAAGWTVHAGGGGTWLSLPGVPVHVWLRERVGIEGLLELDADRLRTRAVLDERALGALAFRPSAEDGLSLWVAQAGADLLRGATPRWCEARHWQERFPSDASRLRAALGEHGLRRLGHFMLQAAARNAPAPDLEPLVYGMHGVSLREGLARVAIAGPRTPLSRWLGSAAAYALTGSSSQVVDALQARARRMSRRWLDPQHPGR